MRRFIACVLLPCCLVACSTWKPQHVSPQQVVSEKQPDKVRVTLTDGTRNVIEYPMITGDSLTGVLAGVQETVPLSTVTVLELREVDVLINLLGVAVFVAFAAILLQDIELTMGR